MKIMKYTLKRLNIATFDKKSHIMEYVLFPSLIPPNILFKNRCWTWHYAYLWLWLHHWSEDVLNDSQCPVCIHKMTINNRLDVNKPYFRYVYKCMSFVSSSLFFCLQQPTASLLNDTQFCLLLIRGILFNMRSVLFFVL